MKVIKRDNDEFTVTLNSSEALKLVTLDHDALLIFSAALMRSMEEKTTGSGHHEIRNDKEV